MQIKELGHVVLYVLDVEKMSHFYGDILGFKKILSSPYMAAFSSGRTHHELLLIQIHPQELKPKVIEPGLYHIGLKVGDTKEELKEAYETLLKNNVQINGTADHHVTNSIYISDPEGNELELYIDTTDDWKENPELIGARPKALDYL